MLQYSSVVNGVDEYMIVKPQTGEVEAVGSVLNVQR